MKFMLSIYGAEGSWTEEERRACMQESLSVCRDLAGQGKYLDASPLEPVATAITVRVREGKPIVTAGPFAETAEQLGGFYLLDLADLDEAIAVACRLPPVHKGTVEIRPLAPLDGLPAGRSSADAGEGPLFLLLCYDDERAWAEAGDEALRAAQAEAAGICRELQAAGKFVSASPLRSSMSATSVRVRAGRRTIIDGPFAETREVLGGYYLIRAADVEDALRTAGRHPGARVGAVEVRRLFDLSELNVE